MEQYAARGGLRIARSRGKGFGETEVGMKMELAVVSPAKVVGEASKRSAKEANSSVGSSAGGASSSKGNGKNFVEQRHPDPV